MNLSPFTATSVLGASLLLVGITSANLAAPPRAKAELTSNASTIVAGEPFMVAVSFKIDPDWHLYWKEPGDSGMPPSVKWTLPEGFTAGELQFPKPEVLKTSAGTNYVYHDTFALLVTITPPATLKIGQTVELSGAVQWLECDKNLCLPAEQFVTTRVQSGARAVANASEAFDQWEAEVKAGASFEPQASD